MLSNLATVVEKHHLGDVESAAKQEKKRGKRVRKVLYFLDLLRVFRGRRCRNHAVIQFENNFEFGAGQIKQHMPMER